MGENTKNSDKFILIYNELDKFMRNYLKVGDEVPNSHMIRNMAKKNKVFRKNEFELLDYSQLRNAIVHNPYKSIADPIAEPHEIIVKKYENIKNKVMHPPKALDICIRAENIYTISLNDKVYDVLGIMSENSYTHVPVLDNNKLVGVFSENTIFSYMVMKKEIVIPKDCLIKEFAEFVPMDCHVSEYFEFVNKETLMIDIEDMFQEYLENLKRLGVIFITESGSKSEKILGLITAWDIAGYDTD